MHTEQQVEAAWGVDPEALDDQVAEMYRGVATEEPLPAPPHARPLGEALAYRPNCAHGTNSLPAGATTSLSRACAAADRRTAAANPHHSNRKDPRMSAYLSRRLIREKLARLHQHAGAPFSHAHGAHRVSLLALNPSLP